MFALKGLSKNLTPRSVSLRGVEFFEQKLRIFPRNRNLRKIILACLSGAQVVSIHEKIAKKSCDTATLRMDDVLIVKRP